MDSVWTLTSGKALLNYACTGESPDLVLKKKTQSADNTDTSPTVDNDIIFCSTK